MKKTKILAMLLMAVFTIGAVCACSSDDDDDYDLSAMSEEQVKESFVGTWKYVENGSEAGEEWSHEGTWQIFADGIMITHKQGKSYDDKMKWGSGQYEGKWVFVTEYGGIYEIVRLSSNSFEIYKEILNGSRVVGYSRYTCKRQ